MPRETSGSSSSNRFDFQLDWALCRLLSLHATGDDYALLLDYHDDVVHLDSASAPTRASFYQVKTKGSGNWTTSALTKRGKGKKGLTPSILGKLFQHTIDFDPYVECLRFVSNAPLSAQDSQSKNTKSLTRVAYSDLHPNTQSDVSAAIASEHNCKDTTALDKFAYEATTLSITDHTTQSLGATAEFLENNDAQSVPAPAFYRTLKSELRRAQQRERSLKSFDELRDAKATTREAFQLMIDKAIATPTHNDVTAAICSRLNTENVPFLDVSAMRPELLRVTLGVTQPHNTKLQADLQSIRTVAIGMTPSDRLFDMIESTRTSPECRATGIENEQGIPYIRSLIAVLLHEHRPLPRLDSLPEEEKP